MGNYCWPAGFWADTSYLIDIPMIMNRKDKNYNFDGKVRAFYESMVQYFSMERTNHGYRPFGCDMSNIESGINYKVMDKLITRWNELGFNQTMEISYSTPT
jgi:hypothetical protein